MPYHLEGNCVKKDDGTTVPGGCHDTHAQALAHLRALMVNVSDVGNQKRDFDPNVGGGVDRDKLDDSDFVFGDERVFPVVAKADVMDAVQSFGRYKGKHSFEDFKRNLTALAKRKGFTDELPNEWTDGGQKAAKGGLPDTLDVLVAPFNGQHAGKDDYGHRFSSKTNFYRDHYPTPPAVYYHGYNPDGSPMGEPEFIGKSTGMRWQNDDGEWLRYQLNLENPYAQRVAQAALEKRAVASSGVVPATKRIAADGHVDGWGIGEVSLFDADPATGRMPANHYAVALPVMKALYMKAGLPLPTDAPQPQAERKTIGMNELMQAFQTFMNFFGAGASAQQPQVLSSAGASDVTAPTPVIVPTAAAAPTPQPKADKVHPREPDKADDNMKAAFAAQQAEIKALKRRNFEVEGLAFVNGIIAKGKAVPAERDGLTTLYVQAAFDDETAASDMKFSIGGVEVTKRLDAFKVLLEAREANPALVAGDMKAAGHDAPDPDKVTPERKAALMGMTLLGRTAAAAAAKK